MHLSTFIEKHPSAADGDEHREPEVDNIQRIRGYRLLINE